MTSSAPIDRTISKFAVLQDAGHASAEVLGNLDRERAHASRRAINQDLASRRNLSLGAQAHCHTKKIIVLGRASY
jgi:hypothetical protein